MAIFKADGQDILVDDIDYPDVSKYTWHMHGNKPRARIYLHDILPDYGKSRVATQHQIPLDRFIYRLTKHANVIIGHVGPQTDCRRSMMYLIQKDQSKTSKFYGVVKRGDHFIANVVDGRETYVLGPFASEYEAAREHDKKAIELMGWRAKTNFIPQLLK